MSPSIVRRADSFRRPRPLYATCDNGVEDLLAAELEALGADRVFPGHRGVGFFGDRQLMWAANVHSRIANRILVPVAEFPATDKETLYAGVERVNWTNWFRSNQTLAVDASSHRSALEHTGYMNQVTKDAICDRFRSEGQRRPSVDKRRPDIRINVRVQDDHCVVSLDSSGERLYRRGYRREAGDAPLKETLAAAILMRSGWNGTTALVDPMCGAGTFLVEGAMMALGIPPGLSRARKGHFAFAAWHGHRAPVYQKWLSELEASLPRPDIAPITGGDVDPEVLDRAVANAERAGVREAIELMRGPIGQARPPKGAPPGVVVVNPPYGKRLGRGEDLPQLYAELGRTLKFHFTGYTAFVIAADEAPANRIGLRANDRWPMRNGAVPCHLMRFELVAARGQGPHVPRVHGGRRPWDDPAQ